MISRVDLKLLEVALSRSDGLNPLDLRSGRSVNYASQRRASYPQTRHESLDPISADGACVTKQCKGTYKQFVVFQSSFQHCFHLKFHLSTLAGTSALRGWTKFRSWRPPNPGGRLFIVFRSVLIPHIRYLRAAPFLRRSTRLIASLLLFLLKLRNP